MKSVALLIGVALVTACSQPQKDFEKPLSQGQCDQALKNLPTEDPMVKFSALQSPPLGRRAWESTAPLRCPDLDSLSKALRSVAECYEQRETPSSIEKALRTLESLKESRQGYSCLNKTERLALDGKILELRKKRSILLF